MSTLNTESPEQILYNNGVLILTVLGGIRLDGLDRMRVTLKIELPESSRPPLRHNLDLYNDTQVEKLIRKTAEKLEAGTRVIEASLAELTAALEEYRLKQIKSRQAEQHKKKQLSEEERQAAEAFLKEPDLLERTGNCIGESGVIGEELNRLLMYLIFTSRKREQPLHVISLGSSGTGKTHLQEKVGQLIPEEERIEITTLSENAFYYFGQRELKNRLVMIEDLDGAENVLYPMRELMSKRKISKTIAHKNTKGETRTIHLVVEGPVSVAGCTTKESIYEDNANRSFLLYLDESKEQDEKIMQYQRQHSAGKADTTKEQEIRSLLQNCQRILQPVKVVNPYAEQLKIPQEVFKPRRSNAHYLAFIEVITFYHQYQRKQEVEESTGEIYIETTLEDIGQANKLMKEILLRKSDDISGACRNYFERLKQYLKNRDESNPSPSGEGDVQRTSSQQVGRMGAFVNKEIRQALRENHSNQKRYMLQLQQQGMIHKVKGDKKKGYYYQISSMEEYEEKMKNITSVLDTVLNKLRGEVQSSQEVHRTGEPLKPNGRKANREKFKSSSKQTTA